MALLFIWIPLFIIGWNSWKIIKYYNRTKQYVRTTATVVNTSIEAFRDELAPANPYTYFSPIIEFTTTDNKTYTLKYTEDSPDRPLFKIGEKITICYDPVEPRKFMIYDPKAEYLVSAVWIAVGLGVIYLMFFFNWESKPPF
jgi:hypothetical protein